MDEIATTAARVRVMLFLAAAIAVAAGLGWALRREIVPGTGDLRLRARFSAVAGLKPGAPVRLAGVEAGRVLDIAFEQHEGADVIGVELLVRSQYAALVRQGARVSIESLGVLGDRYIEIGLADPAAPALTPEAVVQGVDPVTPASMLGKLDGAVDDARVVAGFFRRIVETTEGIKDLWSRFKAKFTAEE